MEQSEFRDLLKIAKEFNVNYFKKGDIEVHFQVDYSPAAQAGLKELDNKPDPDEEFLKKVEELKNQALGGSTF